MGCIYYIRCKINGKGYVGVDSRSDDGSKRWRGHRVNSHRAGKKSMLIKLAIKKYGAENFVIDPVWESDDKDALFAREDFFIQWFNTLHPAGYNLRHGGMGGQHSDESRRRLSEAMNEPGTKQRHKRSMKQKWRNSHYKYNVSRSVKNCWQDEEYRAKTISARWPTLIMSPRNIRVRARRAAKRVGARIDNSLTRGARVALGLRARNHKSCPVRRAQSNARFSRRFAFHLTNGLDDLRTRWYKLNPPSASE
jgi:group I intron endonuclease